MVEIVNFFHFWPFRCMGKYNPKAQAMWFFSINFESLKVWRKDHSTWARHDEFIEMLKTLAFPKIKYNFSD